jgi:16S rRNA processing protein RimM
LKGDVRVEQILENDEAFEAGREVVLAATSGDRVETEIESFRRQHGRCVAKFRGIDSISEAEKYIGNEVQIVADALPELEQGWFYTFQLKGCQVFTIDGELIGTVSDVLGSGGSEILKVDLAGEETLIPFAQEFMKSIDLDQRKIEVDLPEGLRELNK